MQFTPYEKQNLLFIDTEFSDLDPYKGELLSVGMVKLSGEELYIEIAYEGEASKWVEKYVKKTLDGPKFSRQQTITQIHDFLGDAMPFAVAFVDNYDCMYLTKLFGAGKLPFKWMTIDMASILFGLGINPVRFQVGTTTAKMFYESIGIETKRYRPHHALDDARLLREVWLKLTMDAENDSDRERAVV